MGVRSRSARNLSVSVSVRDRVSGKRVDDGVSDEATDSECERMSCRVVCVCPLFKVLKFIFYFKLFILFFKFSISFLISFTCSP